MTLTLTNTPHHQLTVEHSTDLVNWAELGKPTPTASPFILNDSTGAEIRRFYRAFYP